MTEDEIPEAAERQGGVFTAAQAIAEGWSPRQVKRRMAARRWVAVAGRGLAAARSTPFTAFQLATAASLTLAGSVTSHVTAGLLHGFPVAPEPRAHVIIGNHHHHGRNIEVHRLGLDPAEMWRHVSGLRLTSPRRTAVDLFRTLTTDAARDLWAWTASRNLLTVDDLREAVRPDPRAVGAGRLRRLLAAVEGGSVSHAEDVLHDLLRAARIGGWTANTPILAQGVVIAVGDVVFDDARLVVEVDGLRAHSGREAFVGDRRRQNRLMLAGWTVLRFTWHDLVERPGAVVAEIRRALNQAVSA